jgi:hypothetical protein
MTLSYTLNFSDPLKQQTITVPGTTVGPGKNNYSTSLDLIGPGYPNYGQDNAQNFLKLLENFSSPHPPNYAIEGQLWYDTRDPNNKVLRVNNGKVTSGRWPSVSGIYKQPNDPSIEYSTDVVEGDVWVDTANSQLKIRYGSSWTLIGPAIGIGANKTGVESVVVQSNTGTDYPIVLTWANGRVVEIISYSEFTPRSVIDGFSIIKPGANLTTRVSAKFNGLADRASALELSSGVKIGASELLKNRATSQTHTGTFVVESGNGFYVTNPLYSQSLNVYHSAAGGFVNFANTASTFKIGIQDSAYIKFNGPNGNVGINTSPTSSSPTFDVNGSGRFSNTLTVLTTASTALSVAGGARIGGNLAVTGSLSFSGVTTSSNKLIVGTTTGSGVIIEPANNDAYDIGSSSTAFRTIYASSIGSTNTNVDIYGTVYGTVTRLETSRIFSLGGQVAATSITFNGSDNVAFTATLTRSAITDQISTSSLAESHTFLVVNTATGNNPEKISKSDLAASIISPGMILPAGTSTSITGYLLCNGASYSTSVYARLYSVIRTGYGSAGAGFFNVPNLTGVTTAVGSYPIYYFIKT